MLGFLILAACSSPDVQEIAPRGDKESGGAGAWTLQWKHSVGGMGRGHGSSSRGHETEC